MATAFISVPLGLHYLGSERYGVWMTITSLGTFLAFADFGIGNGLVNALSKADGLQSRDLARRSVSSAFFTLSGIALILVLVFGSAYPFVPWARICNVTTPIAAQEAGPGMAAFYACFVLSIPITVVQRVQLGYQEGFSSNLWQSLGSCLGLVAIIITIQFHLGLPWLVAAATGGPLLATAVSWFHEFGRRRSWLLPKRVFFSRESAKQIAGQGALFAAQSLSATLAYGTDNIVIARLFDPERVTNYAVPMRLFSLLTILISIPIAPLWPAYGEAVSRRDNAWIRRTLDRSLSATMAIGVPSVLLLVLLGPWLLHVWLGQHLDTSWTLLAGLAGWCLLNNLGYTLSTFLNGVSQFRFQMICWLALAIGALVGKIVLGKLWGLPGVIWGTVIAQLFFFVIPTFVYAKRLTLRLFAEQ